MTRGGNDLSRELKVEGRPFLKAVGFARFEKGDDMVKIVMDRSDIWEDAQYQVQPGVKYFVCLARITDDPSDSQ